MIRILFKYVKFELAISAMSLRIFGKEVPPSTQEKKLKADGVEAASEPTELEAVAEAEGNSAEAIVVDTEAIPLEMVVVQAL